MVSINSLKFIYNELIPRLPMQVRKEDLMPEWKRLSTVHFTCSFFIRIIAGFTLFFGVPLSCGEARWP